LRRKKVVGTNRTLHADADGAVAEVRVGGLLDGVVVAVDDLVQVARHHLGHLAEAAVVEAMLAGAVRVAA